MKKKVILYGSADCPGCVDMKALFDKEGIKYGYVDVLAGLAHLKKFLGVRDSYPEIYAEVQAHGLVGIPTVVVDDTVVYIHPGPEVIEGLKTAQSNTAPEA